jgi:hypothetical protein
VLVRSVNTIENSCRRVFGAYVLSCAASIDVE